MEVYYSGPPTKCFHYQGCHFKAIEDVVKKFQYQPFLSMPQERFLCSVCPLSTDHLCHQNEDKTVLTCCKDGMSAKDINQIRQLPWIDKNATTIATSKLGKSI